MEKMGLPRPEITPSLEVKSGELLAVIKGLKLKENEPFQFNGTWYQILWTYKKDETASEKYEDAWFSFSTEIDGFDIYLQKSLSKKEKIRRLFHEIFEADLRHEGIGGAHDIALREEERIFRQR